jgi:hypothetical protein
MIPEILGRNILVILDDVSSFQRFIEHSFMSFL